MRRARSNAGELLAVAAHDLRGPLGVVAGYARMLGQPAAGPPIAPTREILESIQRSTDRLTQLLARLTRLADLEQQTVGMTRVEISVDELVAPFVETRRSDAVLVVRGEAGGTVLRADPMCVREAIDALLSHLVRGQSSQPVHLEIEHVVLDAVPERVVLLIGVASAMVRPVPDPVCFTPDDHRPTLDSMVARRLIDLHGGRLGQASDELFRVELPIGDTSGSSAA